jgi:hypothetical protein
MAAEQTSESPLPLTAEWATYRRALPRLLESGHEGRFALIQGDTLIGVYDTFDDADQVGYDRFGLDTEFMAQPIDRRFLQFPESPPPSLPRARSDQAAAS